MASIARLEELKKKFDENPRRYFAPLANEHRKSGDPDQAIALCRAHLPQQPAHISGHIVLAQALFEVQNLEESRQVFNSALELDPENLIALRYMGDIARHSGDVDTARSWYRRVLEVDPRNDEISDLIRDLDATGSNVAAAGSGGEAEGEPPVDVAATSASETAAQDAMAPESAATASVAGGDDDPRFAPVALEAIDFDADFTTPSSDPGGDAPLLGEQASPAESSAWLDAEGGAEATEKPSNASELDPFDMPHSASAESLTFGGSDPSAEAFAGLAGLGDDELGDLAAAADPAADIWGAPVQSEGDAAPAESNDAYTPAQLDAPVADAFEDGAFYADPALAAEAKRAEGETDEAVTPSTEAPASESPTLEAGTERESEHSSDAMPVAHAASSDDPLAADDAHDPWAAADHPTPPWSPPIPEHTELVAEPHTVTDQAEEWTSAFESEPEPTAESEAFVVESMEFVPPDSAPAHTHLAAVGGDADPLLGRTPELDAAEEGETPAAFVTETMAELYLQQGFRNEALAVYRELLAKNPDDMALRERIQQIESGSMSSISIASLSEDVVESARRRQTASPTRTVRSFFASLAGRRPPYGSHRATTGVEPVTEPVPEPVAEPVTGQQSDPHSVDDRGQGFDWDAGDSLGAPPAAPVAASGTQHRASGEAASASRGLSSLFAEAHVPAREEAAAQTLATAFGAEPAGRPTRAASSELSLDHVFRGAPGAPASGADAGGFSFDQFFSDAKPTATENDEPEGAAPSRSADSDAHDIEQFTAWLEGLKKK